MKKSTNGFTITELLIVIVVLAILATIIITTFNEVQQRARNAARISNARNYQTLIRNYGYTFGAYPNRGAIDSNLSPCLGTGYADYDSDSLGDCGGVDTISIRHASIAVTNELQKAGKLPDASKDVVTQTSGQRNVGMHFHFSSPRSIGGVDYSNSFVYYLEGNNRDCVLSPLISYDNGTSSWILSPTNYSGSYSGVTSCQIGLAAVN